MNAPGAWTDLGGGMRVRQSRAFAMNSGLLLHGEHTVVIDPGVLASEIDDLASAVTEVRPAAVTLFFTHGHWDHVLGLPWWPNAEVMAHDRVAGEVHAAEARILAEATKIAEAHGERWTRGFKAFRPRYPASGLHYTRRGPWHLVLRDAPGHSDSQLTLHLPDRGILFAADMLSDVEIPILDRPPSVYRDTLTTLLPLAEHGAIETLVPGHGSIALGGEAVRLRLREDLDYLDELEHRATAAAGAGQTVEQAVQALESMSYRGKSGGPFPMADIHRENVRIAWAAARRDSSSLRADRHD